MEDRPKILVVEDDDQVRSFLGAVLDKKGYQYRLASNAKEATEHLKNDFIDLVLCDIMMPDESGLHLCKKIRAERPEIAVLMVTALDDPKTINDAIKAGADGYITKPIEQESLMSQITTAIYRRRHELVTSRYREWLEREVAKKTKSLRKIIKKLVSEKKEHREKVKMLYSLFNTVHAGIVLVDAETHRVVEINDYGCNIIGLPREKILGKICHEIMCPAEGGKCPVKDMKQKNVRIVNDERTILTAQGDQIPVLKSIEPISLGGKLHYLSSFVDLRERKEFEKEIAKKQHEIETILDSVPAMIFYKDKNNRIVLANKTFSDITGFSKKDIEGKDCRELWPDQADDYWKDDKQVISTGRPKRNIIEKLETSRGTRWIKTDKVPYRNADGTIIGVIGFALDITELKEAEVALKESEERFRAISESAQDAIVMINEKGMVSFWNRAAETVFGYSKQEAMGRDLHELIAPKRYLEKYKKTFRIFRETGKGIAVNKILELDAKRKDGTEFPVELSLSAIQIKGKWHAVGIIRDITERKLMVKALKESEEQFRIAIENSNDGITLLREDKHFYVNKKFLEILGYSSPDELVGKSMADILHPDDRDRVYKFNKARHEGRSVPNRYEARLLRKDGSYVHVEISATLTSFKNKPIILANMRDITERKRAEEALKRSEEKYRLVVENAKEGIIVAQDGKFKFVNPAACHITGYTEEELLSMPWVKFVHPEDRKMVIRHHSNRLSGRKVPKSYLMRIIDKHGQVRWVENDGVVIQWEGKPATLNFLSDVTERKLAEDEFRKAHAELEHLIASLSSILIELSPEGQIKRWNRVAEKVLNISEAEVLGKRLEELPISWDWEKVAEGITRCNEVKEPIRLQDVPFTRRDGTRGFLGIGLTPKLDEERQVKGVILMASDITERRSLETQLLQAQKLESVGQLAAGIAHEINTPTQFVGDNIQFLQEAFKDLNQLLEQYKILCENLEQVEADKNIVQKIHELEDEIDLPYLMEEIPKAIEQSMEGVRRVAKIVRAMKEFSHPGSEEKTLVDLNHAIENTITVAKNEWKYVAEMETDFDPALPPVPCLPGELNQVILNMIINAAHAISDAIGDGSKGKGTIRISTRRAGEWAEIRISDTGTGIPEAIRDRIFDPFFTTKEVGKGTGQGLAIARSMIVDKHGGTIDFETQEGKGTTFIIRLPLEEKVKG